MSFLIHWPIAMIMMIVVKIGVMVRRLQHSSIRGRYITDLYERDSFRMVMISPVDHPHFVRVEKIRWTEDGNIDVTVKHGEHEFWNVPPTDRLPGVDSYEPIFWCWAVTGNRALGAMIQLWHDAVLRHDELLLQRRLVISGLERLKYAIEPLRGSGPISLPRILAYVEGLYYGCLRGGTVDHADLFAAVERPLNLGGRKPRSEES